MCVFSIYASPFLFFLLYKKKTLFSIFVLHFQWRIGEAKMENREPAFAFFYIVKKDT